MIISFQIKKAPFQVLWVNLKTAEAVG